MFDADSPASDVLTLVEFLKQEHQDGDLYRGQRRDYPALIPSTFRGATVAGSESAMVVGIDPEAFHALRAADSRAAARQAMLNRLIAELGISIGNLIAQQYGLTSECLDVSEDLAAAAFFATRAWPEYAHHESDGVGVIYRFRLSPEDLLPRTFDLYTLGMWFEMGMRGGEFFDFFVRQDEVGRVFDRDRWTDWATGQEAEVATLPLTIRWSQVLEALGNANTSSRQRASQEPWRLSATVLAIDWRRTRVGRQKGGFLRPSFHWVARVPPDSELWHRGELRPGPRVIPRGGDWDDGMPWPRVVPSMAVKQSLIGVENLRFRAGFEAFFFRHGPKRLTGLYRRDLWPEPSEDPLYGEIWNRAVVHLMHAHYQEDDLPAVDDKDQGLLDRGYQVRNERQTHDARELDDLMRGQLEDAQEAIAHGQPTAQDYVRAAGGLADVGDLRGAATASVKALRIDPGSVAALQSIAGLCHRRGKPTWARRFLERAAELAPDDPATLHSLATLDFEAGELLLAAQRLDRALECFNPLEHYGPEYEMVEHRAIVAGHLGDNETVARMLARYGELGFNPEPLRAHIESLPSA